MSSQELRRDPWTRGSQTKMGAFNNPAEQPEPLQVYSRTVCREPYETVIFVDGVQRAEHNGFTGQPQQVPWLIVSLAAGAAVTKPLGGTPSFVQQTVQRLIFSAARVPDILHPGGQVSLEFKAVQLPFDSKEAMDEGISLARSNLELIVANKVAAAQPSALIIVDGQLPADLAHSPYALGWIKSIGRFPGPVTWLATLETLQRGQFTSPYQSHNPHSLEWFVATRNPNPKEHATAHLVRLQASNTLEPAALQRLQEWSSHYAPEYASSSIASERAPQQPRPIEALERELGRYLGNPDMISRALLIHSHQSDPLAEVHSSATPPGQAGTDKANSAPTRCPSVQNLQRGPHV